MGCLLRASLLLLPFVEVFLVVRFIQLAGFGNVLLVAIATAVLGVSIVKRASVSWASDWQESKRRGDAPTEGLMRTLGRVIGGLLLIFPGVLTDVVGVLLLFAPTRRLLTIPARHWVKRSVMSGNIRVTGFDMRRPPHPGAPSAGERIPDGSADAPIKGRVISSEDEP